MCNHRLKAKTVLKSAEQLWCQADLRHQQQCLPALLQDLLKQTQVHLGLTTAGNTIKQMAMKVPEGFTDGVDCILLLIQQHWSFKRIQLCCPLCFGTYPLLFHQTGKCFSPCRRNQP